MQITTEQGTVSTDQLAALRHRLDKLTTSQQRMQRVNSYLRNRNTRGLKEMGYTDAEIANLFSGAKANRGAGFFASYKLANVASQIRALRAEVSAAELASGDLPSVAEGSNYTYRADALAVSFEFMAKPDKGTRAVLSRAGFVRAGGQFCYKREWSADALRAASSVRLVLDV